MMCRSLLAVVLGLSLTAGPVLSASLSTDLLGSEGSGSSLEQSLIDGALPDVLGTMTLANREYAQAVEEVEARLRDLADYASILQLAPQLTLNAPDPDKVRWMHALALAAGGDLEAARAVILKVAKPEAQVPLAYLARAMIARRLGNTDEAIELTRAAILKQPTYAYAYNLMGTIKAELGEAEEATEWFKQATVYSGRSPIYWRNLGIMQLRADRITIAAKSLQNALAIAPNDCVALVAMAELYEAARQSETAETFVERCIDDGVGNRVGAIEYLLRQQFSQNDFAMARALVDEYEDVVPGADLIRAEIALQSNAPAEALGHLERLPAGRARDIRRVFAMAMQGQIAPALEALREIPVTGGGDAVSSAFLEVVLSIAAGETPRTFAMSMAKREAALEKAMVWYEAMLLAAEDPVQASIDALKADDILSGVRFDGAPVEDWAAMKDPNIRAHMALGMLWHLRDYKAAAAASFDAASAGIDLHQAAYLGALADFELGEIETARDKLQPTADAKRDYFSAQVLMAEIYLRFGALGDALRHYEDAARVSSDPGALMRVGVLADMEGKPDVAEKALRRFIQNAPDSYVGYNQLAWVFIQREIRLDEALELAQKADALQPGNASILDNIGWVKFLQGETSEAVLLLREANRLSGNANPDVLYHLAAAEAELGGTQTAQSILSRLFEAAPEDHPAVIAGRDLEAKLN